MYKHTYIHNKNTHTQNTNINTIIRYDNLFIYGTRFQSSMTGQLEETRGFFIRNELCVRNMSLHTNGSNIYICSSSSKSA